MTTFAPSKHHCHEANISAIQQEKKEQAWFQGADVIFKRSQHSQRKKEERP
jgi:hypothetical protein